MTLLPVPPTVFPFFTSSYGHHVHVLIYNTNIPRYEDPKYPSSIHTHLDFLTLEDGKERLSRNVGEKLPPLAAC
jgi:hypothetical protein